MSIETLQKQTNANIQAKANLIWEISTHLVGLFKPHEYGKVILPMTVLKRSALNQLCFGCDIRGYKGAEALNAAIRRRQAQTFAVQTVEGLSRLEVRQIRYAEMLRRGVQFYLRDGTVLPTRLKISDIEQVLPQQRFFRCHQGYIVNLDAISTILRADAVLENGQHIPVSRYRLADLREHFLTYLHDA